MSDELGVLGVYAADALYSAHEFISKVTAWDDGESEEERDEVLAELESALNRLGDPYVAPHDQDTGTEA